MRIAVIGLGSIAPVHLAAIMRSGEELAAICDIDEGKALEFKSRNSLSCPVYTDYKAMLDEIRPDTVHICTPHYLHCEMICEALRRDINAFCEKPVAISEEQLDKIHKTLEATHAQLGVCHQNRYNESIRYAKALMSSSPIKAASGLIAWCRDEAYYKSADWRGKWSTEGGGLVINQAIHTLDLLMDFCGMPKSVIAHTHNDTLKGVIEVEDGCSALFTVSDTVKFSLHGTNGLCDSLPCAVLLQNAEHSVCIYNASFLIVDGKLVEIREESSAIGKWEWGVGHSKIIKDFYAHIKEGRHFPLDIDDAERVVKMILALYKSNGKKTEIV